MRQSVGQKGIIDLHLLTVLLVGVTTLAGVFWMVQQRSKPQTKISAPLGQPAPQETNTNNEAPLRYSDSDGKFTISYPAGWQLDTTKSGDGARVFNVTTLTSLSGKTKLYLSFQSSSIESNCIADYYDKPFLITNRCFSAEFVSAQPLPTPAFEKQAGHVVESQWYLVHYHFKTNTINARELYASCLLSHQPELQKPQMGFLADHPISPVITPDGNEAGYFAACVDAGSQATDYNNPEVIAGEAILRSLRFDY